MKNALNQLSAKMNDVLQMMDEELQKTNTEITPEQKMLYEQNSEKCNQLIDSGMDVEDAFRECGFLKEGESISENDKELIKSLRKIDHLMDEIEKGLNEMQLEENEYEY